MSCGLGFTARTERPHQWSDWPINRHTSSRRGCRIIVCIRASSPENGAWQVYGNFLIHDGPDNPSEIFATIGCIEIMGVRGFVRFNDVIIGLSGPKAKTRDQRLIEIGGAGRMSITYARASRPALKKAP